MERPVPFGPVFFVPVDLVMAGLVPGLTAPRHRRFSITSGLTTLIGAPAA
jgi:hypothetical protein